jgi:hypothetical protein
MPTMNLTSKQPRKVSQANTNKYATVVPVAQQVVILLAILYRAKRANIATFSSSSSYLSYPYSV